MTFDHVLIKRRTEASGAEDGNGLIGTIWSTLGISSANGNHSRTSSSLSSSWSTFSSFLKKDITELKAWDEGLVYQSLGRNGITPRDLTKDQKEAALGWIVPVTAPANRLRKGTFHGTSRALTQVFELLDKR